MFGVYYWRTFESNLFLKKLKDTKKNHVDVEQTANVKFFDLNKFKS